MATETIRIIISEKGSKEVARAIKSVGDEARRSSEGVDVFQRALLAVSTVFVAKQAFDVASAYQALQNRLRLVTNGTQELTAVTQALMRVANETYSVFTDTAELFARVAFNTRDLGLTQERVLTITKALNQAVVLSGATAREASAAIIQLSQGLASGTLRGDELRSVLEQLPFVADVISKQLGVTRGALRFLGAEGKITAQQIVDAFEKAAPSIDEQFKKLKPTFEQSMSLLKNAFMGWIASMDEATSASMIFNNALGFIARNISTVAGTLAILSTALVVAKVAVMGLNFALLANPVGATILAVGAAAAALYALSGSLEVASVATEKQVKHTVTLRDQMAAAVSEAVDLGSHLSDLDSDATSNWAHVVGFVKAAVSDLLRKLGLIGIGLAHAADAIIGTIGGIFAAIGGAIGGFIGGLFGPAGGIDRAIGAGAREAAMAFVDVFKGVWENGFAGFFSNVSEEAKREAQRAAAASEASMGGQIPGGGGPDQSKSDIAVQQMKQQLGAERELLAIGQTRGQLQFNTDSAMVKLRQKMIEQSNVLSDAQYKELAGLVEGNEAKKLSNALDQERDQAVRRRQNEIALLGMSANMREVEAQAMQLANGYAEKGVAIDMRAVETVRQLAQQHKALKDAADINETLDKNVVSMGTELKILEASVDQRERVAAELKAAAMYQEKGLAVDQDRVMVAGLWAEALRRAHAAADISHELLKGRDAMRDQMQLLEYSVNQREIEAQVIEAANRYKAVGLRLSKEEADVIRLVATNLKQMTVQDQVKQSVLQTTAALNDQFTVLKKSVNEREAETAALRVNAMYREKGVAADMRWVNIIRMLTQRFREFRDTVDIQDSVKKSNDAIGDQIRLLDFSVHQREAEAEYLRVANMYKEKGLAIDEAAANAAADLVEEYRQRREFDSQDTENFRVTRDMREQVELLHMGSVEAEVQADVFRLINSYKDRGIAVDEEAVAAFKSQRLELQGAVSQYQALVEIQGDRARVEAELLATQRLYLEGLVTEDQLLRKAVQTRMEMRKGDLSIEAGLENGVDSVILKISDFASVSQDLVTNAYSNMEDAVVRFAQTGELSFTQMVDGMIADLTRLLMRILIIKGVQAIGSLFGGGIGTAMMGGGDGLVDAGSSIGGAFHGHAAGGGVLGGTMFPVGERGTEMFVAPANGTIVPNSDLRGMGGPPMTVQVVNVYDRDQLQQMLNSPEVTEQIVNNITKGTPGAALRSRIGAK